MYFILMGYIPVYTDESFFVYNKSITTALYFLRCFSIRQIHFRRCQQFFCIFDKNMVFAQSIITF